MNEYYKQPVVVFGVALPLLGLILIFAVSFNYRSKFEQTFRIRKDQYVTHQKVTKQREALEEKIDNQRPYLSSWMGLFDQAADSSVNAVLNDLETRFSGNEIQQTSFRRSPASGGIGGASKQTAVQLQLSFRGTYRGLQNAFLEMEARMPQLQMDNLKLRKESNRNLLNAEVTYTAWQTE